MSLRGEGEARLSEFLEWTGVSESDEARIRDFRQVASSLLELADGGRVNETHILKLIDAHSEGPAGKAAVELIEDVGEQMLRFQTARRASAASVPLAPMPDTPSRPLRSSTSQPFVARPEERIAGELRPPVAASPSAGPPSVVSFASGSTPPEVPPPHTPIPLLVNSGMASGPLLIPSGASGLSPDRSTRSSATLFRCWKCKVMVESDVDGRCPRCGTPSPRISSAQQTVVAVARRRRWLPAAIVAALIAIGVVGVPRVLERLHHPSESVAGELRSAHLGVRLQFPEGWRHLREGDRAPSTALDVLGDAFGDPLSLRSSRFFRGAAGDPAAELFVVVGARAGGLGDAALASWAQAVAETPEKLEGPIRDLTGVKDLRMFQCTSGSMVPHGGLRCAGVANHRPALLYLWSARGNMTMGLFLSSAGPEAALAESTDVLAGLDP